MKNKVYKILSLLLVILFLDALHLTQAAEIIVTGSHTPFIDQPLCKCNDSDCTGPCPVLCGRQYIFQAFDVDQDVAFNGGEAQNAVASDTITGSSIHGCPFSLIHSPEFVNDGYYGNGSSWIAAGFSNPWLKIDLGREVLISGISFGRERVVTTEGPFNDRDPGRFFIAIALTDDSYENGNDNNDGGEYSEIIDSNDFGFTGNIDGPQTVEVSFEPVLAKYVKLMFSNSGVAIDEVEIREADTDGDGIPDSEDSCSNSDLSETVVIGGCDSHIQNIRFADGCTISDFIWECAEDADNHGDFVSCVSHFANDLRKDGIISGREKGRIQSCAAKADIP